jgi:hypothetical protein
MPIIGKLSTAAIYGVWRPKDLGPILESTLKESTMLMLIIGMSLLYSYVMSYLHISQAAAQAIVAMHLSRRRGVVSAQLCAARLASIHIFRDVIRVGGQDRSRLLARCRIEDGQLTPATPSDQFAINKMIDLRDHKQPPR